MVKYTYRKHPQPKCTVTKFKGNTILRNSRKQTLLGITKSLHRLLYPNFVLYSKSNVVDPTIPTKFMRKEEPETETIVTKTGKVKEKKIKQPKIIKGGMKTGNKIDKDCIQAFELMDKYDIIKYRWFLEKDYCQKQLFKHKKTIEKKDAKKVLELVKRRNPYLRQICTEFRARSWRVIGWQFPVCIGKYGTMIDLLVLDLKTWSIRVGELKTGYEQTLNLSSGNQMKEPLNAVSDCPFNQFYIQAGVGHLMYKAEFPQQKTEEPFVIHCTSYGCEIRLRPQWLKDKTQELLQLLGITV